ncbi:hypothetical protein OIU85_003519, partial [Salix viminalis]
TGNKDSVNRSRVVSVTGDDPIVVEIITVNYFGSVELSFGESIAQSISESSHQHNHPQKPIHGYDGSRMIPFGRPARRYFKDRR